MDEQEIRQWAWKEFAEWGVTNKETKERRAFTHTERLDCADNLAAWVMSGKLPQEKAEE